MTTEQKIEESNPKSDVAKEEPKNILPGLMTAKLMELKINNEIAQRKLSIANLETRALQIVKNEDNLKIMDALLKDIDDMEDIASETCKTFIKPHEDAVKNGREGKKLVSEQLDRIRGMIEPDYDRLLEGVADKERNAAIKAAQDKAIKKGIEDTAGAFVKRIVSAETREELSSVQRLINLEKSPSRAKKYGDLQPQAVNQYDEILMPIIHSQKVKLGKLEMLHGELEEAQSDGEEDDVVKLKETIGEVSAEILQNQAAAGDILSQEFFPVVEAEEVLPEFRTKRTDISYELADAAVALKKVPQLLTITLDKKEVKKVGKKLKELGAFDGKKELIVDGIKYIITRKREAL